MDDEQRANEVNRLYWESDTSVGRIADRLGISRRALYDALTPWPTGVPCPECGAGLVFTNRSHRGAGAAECLACGAGPDPALLRQATADAGAAMRREADRREARAEAASAPPADEVQEAHEAHEREPEWDARRTVPVPEPEAAWYGRLLLIGGSALAGVALGALAVLVSRRRP